MNGNKFPKLKHDRSGVVVLAETPGTVFCTVNNQFTHLAPLMVSLLNAAIEMPETIYQVETFGDVEGRSKRTLAFAAGNPADIREFYNDKTVYDLLVTPIKLTYIDPDVLQKIKNLLTHKKEAQDRLSEVNAKLKEYGYE